MGKTKDDVKKATEISMAEYVQEKRNTASDDHRFTIYSSMNTLCNEIIPGCGYSAADAMSAGIVISKNEPQSKAEIRVLIEKTMNMCFIQRKSQELFTNVAVCDNIYDVLLSNQLFDKHYSNVSIAEETIRNNIGFKRLKYLPYLLWINIYRSDEFVYAFQVPNLRDSCYACGKKHLDFNFAASAISDAEHNGWKLLFQFKTKDTCRLLDCARCQKVKYCSQECQKKHWKIHKKICKKCI